jgi:threonine/homoserine/homoserine lactone efflux protein
MIWSFIVATALITLLPGPSLLVIVAAALREGWRAGAAAPLGVVTADAILLLAALSGLDALAQASPLILLGLKWLGAGYLLWLGVGQLRASPSGQEAVAQAPGGAFRRGLMATLPNPKIIGFLIVYFPQFIQPGQDAARQMLLLGPLFLLTVLAVFLLCVAATCLLSGRLVGKGQSWPARLCGCCLIGCGLYSAFG